MQGFNKLRNLGQRVVTGIKAVGTMNDAVQTAHSAFSGVSDELPHSGMMGNPAGARGRQSYIPDIDDEDEPEFEQYYQEPIPEITESLKRNFEQKAKIKTQIIAGQIRKQYLWRRLLAKLVIQNKGDAQVANKYKDFTEDEIKELPKNIQLIIRNQNHLKAIDSIKIDKALEESCIEYFMMEFEEDYRNGIQLDLRNTNPVELMVMQYNQPFDEVLADIGIDWGLEAKPKVMQIVENVFTKYFGKNQNEVVQEAPIVEETPSAEVLNSSQEINPESNENPSTTEEVVTPNMGEEQEPTNLVQLPTAKPQRWSKTYLQNQEMPNEGTPRWLNYLASKGLTMDMIQDENNFFDDIDHRLRFLAEFDNNWQGEVKTFSIAEKLNMIQEDIPEGHNED